MVKQTSKPIAKRSNTNKSCTDRAQHISKALKFGKKIGPNTIVVMFHGQGDNANGCSKDWANVWAAGLKNSLIVVPEAPDLIYQDEGSGKTNPGHDWIRQRGLHDYSDHNANVRELQRATRSRMVYVNKWLDGLLRSHKLTNKDLIIVGFSQGCIPAAIAGANRGIKAVLLCGGVGKEDVYSLKSRKANGSIGQPCWARWEELMPKSAPGTKFFALEGTKDRAVPRKSFENMMAKFDTTWRWEPGLWHYQLFYKRFRGTLLRWMQSVEANEQVKQTV